MDILMLNPFFYPYMGGTEKVIRHIGMRLARKHGITVLAASHAGAEPEETIDGMEVIRSPARVINGSIPPLPPPVPIFRRYLRDIRMHGAHSDIIHIHNRFLISPLYLPAVKSVKKTMALTIHNARPCGIDLLTDTIGGIYDDIFGHALMRSCAGISGVSESALCSTVPKGYPGTCATIHNGIDENLFRPGRPSGQWLDVFRSNGIERRTVFTNARLVPQKGLGYLIEAMQGMDADLVVLGRGPLKPELEAKAKSCNVQALFLTGRIEEEGLASLLDSVDIFALPSIYEPCGLALLEAMGSGKPVVATGVGGIPELVENNKSGLLVPPRSPLRLRHAIEALLGDGKLAGRLGRGARKRVMEHFTWDLIAKRYEQFYAALG